MNVKKYLNDIRFGHVFTKLKGLSVLEITGQDVQDFLSKQLTSKVKNLVNDSFQSSAVIDIKGRLIAEFVLLKKNSQSFTILVDTAFEKQTIERLNLYLVSEDVEISELGDKDYYAIWGGKAHKHSGYQGKLYNEFCTLVESIPGDIEEISDHDLELLRFSSGQPKIGKEVYPNDLITNSFLVETCVSQDKGCYPGQETVSKVLNNKGASRFPVCLSSKVKPNKEELKINDKKIGKILNTIEVKDEYLSYCLIARQFRVANKSFKSEDVDFTVYYFPLFNNSVEDKAIDLYDLAIDEFHKDHEKQAIKYLEQAIEFDPLLEDAYETLGVIYGRLGDNEKAIELMHKLSELNPKSVMAHTNLSLYYMKAGDKETAEEHKSLATVKQFEQLGEEAQAKKAQEQKEKQEQDEMNRKEGMFKQVLEIDSNDPLANFGMGEIEFKRSNYSQSETYLKRAIKSDPKYSVAYLALAKTLESSCKKDELKEILDQGIDIATNNGDLMPANEMQSIYNANFRV